MVMVVAMVAVVVTMAAAVVFQTQDAILEDWMLGLFAIPPIHGHLHLEKLVKLTFQICGYGKQRPTKKRSQMKAKSLIDQMLIGHQQQQEQE